MVQNSLMSQLKSFTFPRIRERAVPANGRTSGPVLTSGIMVVLDQSAVGFAYVKAYAQANT